VADYKLLGKNYQTPDLYAKVTGRSKYAEDHRAEGMVFCKLLVSPMPHARVRSLDVSAALALPGVEGILTPDDVLEFLGEAPTGPAEISLTNEPHYEGEPIVAVAAVSEQVASDAINLIEIDLEPLPFVLDPLDSLHPGGPNARLDGNTRLGREMGEVKWTESDMAGVATGEIPMEAEATSEWSYGDLEAGFAEADVIIEEHSYSQSTSHQPLESRTTVANSTCIRRCKAQLAVSGVLPDTPGSNRRTSCSSTSSQAADSAARSPAISTRRFPFCCRRKSASRS
jgi:xanthine dehydrogenase molybdenum-binding subunit